MPWVEVVWTEENEAHIAEHGLSIAEVEHVLRNPIGSGVSRSTGRPYAVGYTTMLREVIVVYEELDAITVYPITAYVLE
jgi:uncharacterized DUF497 family protein